MTLAVKAEQLDPTLMEQVIVGGDLSNITPEQRVEYYQRVCESLGLNPMTKPFQYITLNGKLTLYASKDCTEQLRALRGISIETLERETIGEVYVVTANARDNKGRKDSSTGAVPIQGVKGEALANAFMKAETKAKRRVTLSLSGLGWLDESEVSSIPGAQVVDMEPTRVVEAPAQADVCSHGKTLAEPCADCARLQAERDTDAELAAKIAATALTDHKVDVGLANVGELMTYANDRWGSTAYEILGALGVQGPGEIKDPNDARRQLDLLWGDK